MLRIEDLKSKRRAIRVHPRAGEAVLSMQRVRRQAGGCERLELPVSSINLTGVGMTRPEGVASLADGITVGDTICGILRVCDEASFIEGVVRAATEDRLGLEFTRMDSPTRLLDSIQKLVEPEVFDGCFHEVELERDNKIRWATAGGNHDLLTQGPSHALQAYTYYLGDRAVCWDGGELHTGKETDLPMSKFQTILCKLSINRGGKTGFVPDEAPDTETIELAHQHLSGAEGLDPEIKAFVLEHLAQHRP